MKKRIIVACAGAVATSTMASEEISDLCIAHGIDIDIIQCRISEIETYQQDACLICTTARIDRTFGTTPIVHGMAFISGVGVDALTAQILSILKA